MTLRVKGPRNIVVNFPDGTDEKTINSVMGEAYAKTGGATHPEVMANVPDGALRQPEKSLSGLMSNIGTDSANIAGGVYNAVRHPLDTIDAVTNLGAGAAFHGWNGIVPQSMQFTPHNEIGRKSMDTASTVGQQLANDYGSWDAVKNTAYERPVGSLLDVAGLAAGGEGLLLRAGMKGSKAASLLGKVSEAANPVNLITKPIAKISESMAGSRAMKSMLANAPDTKTVANTKNALYGQLQDAGIKFDADGYTQTLSDIADGLKNYRSAKAPLTSDTIDNLAQFNGKSPTFQDMEGMLQDAKSILREQNASNTDKSAAHVVIDHLNNFFDKGAMMSNDTINPSTVPALAAKARDFARRDILGKQLSEMGRKAEYYVSNADSGFRNQASSMGKRQGKGLTEMENAALLRVVRKEGIGDVISKTGSGMAAHIVPAITGAVGTVLGGPVGGVAGYSSGLGINLLARRLAESAARKSADRLTKTVLAGKKAQNAAKAARKPLIGANDKRGRNILLGGQGLSLLGERR